MLVYGVRYAAKDRKFDCFIASFASSNSTKAKKCEDDSVYDFVSRRLGSDIANFAIDPLIRGICAGDAKKISAGIQL